MTEFASDYKSENCTVEFLSGLSAEEACKMIGKVVERVDAREYGVTLTFSDGSKFEASGASWGDCSLDVGYSDK